MYVEVCVCFEIFLLTSGVSLCVCSVHVYVVYEDTNVYNDMGMTVLVKSSHLYLYSAFNNTDCVKALNSIKLEDRVSVMYNN